MIECTTELNEWVYPADGKRTRLMSTQLGQLPELVRRFTQDVYMCIYVQPDAAMCNSMYVHKGHPLKQEYVSNQQYVNLPQLPQQFNQSRPPQYQDQYHSQQQQSQPIAACTGGVVVPSHYHLGVGSTVQLQTTDPSTPQRYGVIRWVGEVPGVNGQIAGIELVRRDIV